MCMEVWQYCVFGTGPAAIDVKVPETPKYHGVELLGLFFTTAFQGLLSRGGNSQGDSLLVSTSYWCSYNHKDIWIRQIGASRALLYRR